jgi:hypothetical protein
MSLLKLRGAMTNHSESDGWLTAEKLFEHLDKIEELDMKYRKDKYFNLGFCWLHYIHYYPQQGSPKQWGFSAYNFKNFTIDLWFGKHVIVFSFRDK